MSWTRAQVAALVDHTLLKPEATPAEVTAVAEEAAALGAYAVCVSPSMVAARYPRRRSGRRGRRIPFWQTSFRAQGARSRAGRRGGRGGGRHGDRRRRGAGRRHSTPCEADIAAVRAAVPGAVLKVIVESAALLTLADEHDADRRLPRRRGCRRRLRQDLNGFPSRRRRIAGRRHADGRHRRRSAGSQSQRRHPHGRVRPRDARRRRYPARVVGNPRGARRAGLNCPARPQTPLKQS